MRVQLVVCNVCGDPSRKTKPYAIKRDGERSKTVDLCIEHGEPIDELLDEGQSRADNPVKPVKKTAKKAASGRRSSGRTRSATIAEINATK